MGSLSFSVSPSRNNFLKISSDIKILSSERRKVKGFDFFGMLATQSRPGTCG